MTTTKTLLSLVFEGDLEEYVKSALADGDSWRTVAAKVSAQVGPELSVSHETLRQWFGGVAA